MNMAIASLNNSVAVREYFRSGNVAQLGELELDFVLSKMCERYDLDPILRPFDLIDFRGVRKIYMTASATNQLADKKKLSRKILAIDIDEAKMIARCSVQVSDPSGRSEDSNAWISISRFLAPTKDNPVMKKVLLEGDELANALLKLETKAKRRATMSFFGIMDSGADYEATQATSSNEPFIDVSEPAKTIEAPKPEAKAEIVQNAEQTTTERPKRATRKIEKAVEAPKVEAVPEAETKAIEAKIETHVEAIQEPVTDTRKKTIYNRRYHAHILIASVSKLLNDYNWTKNEAHKEKVKKLIPELDGKVACVFEGTEEVCPEFEATIKSKLV